METLTEIWQFLRVRKRFWLAPIFVALLLLGLLIAFGGASGSLSGLIYMM